MSIARSNRLPIGQQNTQSMTTNWLNCCLPRRKGKLKITRKKDHTTTNTDETNNNVKSKENSFEIGEKAEQTVSMDENSLHGIVVLVNFKPLERTEQDTFGLRTESQRVKRNKSTRSWIWANLDWEGSLTDESSSTNSAESSESEEYYEYIPPIEYDEDPSDKEKTEMIVKWLSTSNVDLYEDSQLSTIETS